jgi:hypothetical protein
LAQSSVSLLERQFETSGLLLRAMQSTYSVSGDIDQSHFEPSSATCRRRRWRRAWSRSHLPAACRATTAPRALRLRAGRTARRQCSLLRFDVVAQPANVRRLEQARDIDQPVMSAVFALRQPTPDPGDALGVTIRLPCTPQDPCPRTWPSAVAARSARWR